MDVVMPQLGESVVEGTVVRWLVKPGDRVRRDQPLVEISTDKADTEIPSPAGGVMGELLVDEGEVVEVGRPVARLEAEAEKEEGARPSPVVRRLARELGVDLSQLRGTGHHGRVTKEDVLGAGMPVRERVEREPLEERPVAHPPEPQRWGYTPAHGDRVIPFSARRRAIADHLVHSLQTAAQVTTVAEVDLHRIARLRERAQPPAPSWLALVAIASVRALAEHPRMNAAVVDASIVERKGIHLGIAVETEAGLVVPVVRDAERLSVRGLDQMIADLAERARQRKLPPAEAEGASFTVSNPGRHGNLFGTPILNQPQVGLLRMGEIVRRPLVVDFEEEEALVIRPVMLLALTYDHRAIDGAPANEFLHRVRELLEAGEFSV